jgi:chloramphenicol O-acetyltransferase type A
MNYKEIDLNTYYRRDIFRHFSEDCKCSSSITARVDVTELIKYSKETDTKFYINFLYLLCRALNSRDDYKMVYDYRNERMLCYNQVNPIQYIFHEDTETITPVYSLYNDDWQIFCRDAEKDVCEAKKTRDYKVDGENHPNWFDASYIPWLSYDSLNIELPDGYLYFQPIINWGKYREENGRWMLPLTVRMNHAEADGFLIANVYRLLEKEIAVFVTRKL